MFNFNKQITKDNIKRKLFLIVFTVITILFVSNVVVLFAYSLDSFTEKLQTFHDNLVKQIGNSYDMAAKQGKDSLKKLLVYDDELTEYIDNYSGDVMTKSELVKKLDEILIESDIVDSVYLYISKTDEISVVSRSSSSFVKKEAFSDAEAFSYVYDDVLFCDFKTRVSQESGSVIMTLCVHVPGTEDDRIAVNIKMDDVYNTVDANEPDSKSLLIIKDENNNQIFPNPQVDLTKAEIRLVRGGKISYYNSYKSGWKFSLYFSNLNFDLFSPSFLLFFIVTMIIALIVIYMTKCILNIYVAPISKIISEHTENDFKNVVLGQEKISKEIFETVFGGEIDTETAYFCVIIIDCAHTDMKMPDSFTENIRIVSFKLSNTQACHVLLFENKPDAEEGLCVLTEKLRHVESPVDIVSVSGVKMGYSNVPSLFTQASLGLKYQIYANSHVIDCGKLNFNSDSFEYDYEKERRLINNMITGNYEACQLYLMKFFEDIKNCDSALDDDQIKNIVYQLQNSILKSIAGYPIPIRAKMENNLFLTPSLDSVREEMAKLIDNICNEINRKDENEKYELYNVVMEYIEKNYTRSDISNTLIADELNINKSFLSKIIKECTGESLPNYVNKKRIELAKQLLSGTEMSVEEIAGNVGFSYSYYFIKIFKSMESITPGEYRKINKNQ